MNEEKINIISKSIEGIDRSISIKESDMELINKFARRQLKSDEVYIFSVVLCDNDIDRQNERFSDESLDKLAKLFVGKTGIMDHECKSENQTARIFDCDVQTAENKQNQLGNPYKRLVAKAYMPKTEKNKEFIVEIEAGIKKEVSINCSVETMTCSICGKDAKTDRCEHIKGRVYKKGKEKLLCHSILENPIDAYEWSFVAVPAQKEAGVIKAFKPKFDRGEFNMQNIVKKLGEGESVTLNSLQSLKLYEMIKELEEKSKIGEEYFSELKAEVIKLSKNAQPDIEANVMGSVVDKMSLHELKSFKEAYRKKNIKNSGIRPQLSHNAIKTPLNTQFRI